MVTKFILQKGLNFMDYASVINKMRDNISRLVNALNTILSVRNEMRLYELDDVSDTDLQREISLQTHKLNNITLIESVLSMFGEGLFPKVTFGLFKETSFEFIVIKLYPYTDNIMNGSRIFINIMPHSIRFTSSGMTFIVDTHEKYGKLNCEWIHNQICDVDPSSIYHTLEEYIKGKVERQ